MNRTKKILDLEPDIEKNPEYLAFRIVETVASVQNGSLGKLGCLHMPPSAAAQRGLIPCARFWLGLGRAAGEVHSHFPNTFP